MVFVPRGMVSGMMLSACEVLPDLGSDTEGNDERHASLVSHCIAPVRAEQEIPPYLLLLSILPCSSASSQPLDVSSFNKFFQILREELKRRKVWGDSTPDASCPLSLPPT